MLNIYDYIANGDLFKKFEVDDLLFVEYKCLIDEVETGCWTHNNCFIYVLGGKKKWITGKDEYIATGGEAIFVKRGAYTAHKYFDEEFCCLLIFVSDDFIRKVLSKYPRDYFPAGNEVGINSDTILRMDMDASLEAYFYSVLSYFPKSVTPPKDLLTIKFEELILNIMTHASNQELKSYFLSIRDTGKVSIRQIMERFFTHNMSLEEYARLCARSLSAFKEDFQAVYKMPPGKWLTAKRLDYAKLLIETTDEPIGDIAFKSGFRNTSHFIRIFKEAYGKPPLQHRLVG